ncbi:hypothetical protein KSP39_PZI017572 [Platanthera zijinensis]|uniref:HD domain-containing protein n=1 Tax=Platanthera zijinensis TaxID=2320716 RepID=A0AAP0B4X1_9ASPA
MPGRTIEEEELTFCLEETLVGIFPRSCESSVLRLLAGAQSRHAISHENILVKVFYEAEKARGGQIGVNSLVVAASMLHDSIDDSFMSYSYKLRIFGAEVAD